MIARHKHSMLVILLIAICAIIAALLLLGEGLHLRAWIGPFGSG
jgi:hypothetical protein